MKIPVPTKYQKYVVDHDHVDPAILAHSGGIFQYSILETPVFKNLEKFCPYMDVDEKEAITDASAYSMPNIISHTMPNIISHTMPNIISNTMASIVSHTMPHVISSTMPTVVSYPSYQAERLVYETYDLIRAGMNQTIFDPKYKDVTLVVGNSGTGKSTLVQFIAGDISQLIAVKKGSGLVIEDSKDRISKKDSNSESKTLFPELIINQTGTMAFYDCPGFKDNRGSAFAMAASHFTKLVFDKAEKIKIHICVDYSVANGAERGQAFIEAMKHVGEFMKDAKKFDISFSMTATKVPRTLVFDEETGDDKLKTDDEEIQGIGDTIKSDSIPLLRSQLAKETDEHTKQILVNALAVFEALSTMENGKYTRIGLFRTPQVAGPLSKSKAMLKSKETIISAVEKKTEFVAVSKGDFNFTIDAVTKVKILVVGKSLNENVKKSMNQIGFDTVKDCTERMHGSKNWKKTELFLTDVKATLNDYSKKLKALPKLDKHFILELGGALRSVNVNMSKENLTYLEKQLGCLDFLNNMFEESTTTIPTTSLDDASKFVSQAVGWYKILYEVYNTLSSDTYQASKDLYNVADLVDWGKPTKNKGLRVSALTASRFFQLLKIDVSALDDFVFTEVRMNELNSVVHLTLVEKTEITVTKEGVLVATGPFILLSQVVEEYKKKEGQIKNVNIFASCVLYIDNNFVAPGRHMVIAAPEWKVKNDFKITLDGESGKDGPGWAAPEGRGATPGEAGVPGGSGKASGHFFGIAGSIDNAEFLTITANGGRGGKGQTGGKGGKAARGVDAIMPTDNSDFKPTGKRYDLISGWSREGDGFTWEKVYIVWRVYGSRAEDGEQGGNGGCGGYGGPKGNVVMVVLSPNAQYPNLRNADGDEGENGAGGEGGDGAKHGNDLAAKYWKKMVVFVESSGWDQDKVFDTGSSSTGWRGQIGGNKEGREGKVQQVPVTVMAFSLNGFKKEAMRFASNSPLLRERLRNMLAQIDVTDRCNEVYTTSAYLNEITTMESLFYSIYKSIDTTQFYSSLLKRINAYADAHKSDTKKIEKLVLSTAYSSCLSKLCYLQLGAHSQGLIIDLEKYIDLTLERVNNLATMDKRTAIKEFRDTYHKTIEMKVKEANDLIKLKVKPSIDKILRSMDDKLDALVDEVLSKEEQAKEKKAELIEQKKQMEKALLIKSCLNVLKMGAMLASFAGPIGAAVGGVITAGATIGESFVVEPDVRRGDAILVPPGVTDALKSLGDLVAETRAKKFEKFETQLKAVQDQLKDAPVDLQDVNKKMQSIKERLDEEKKKVLPDGDDAAEMTRDNKVKELEQEFKGVLSEKRTGLEEKIAKGDKAKKKILDTVDKIEKGLKVVEAGLDVYNKYKGDKKKLDAISDSIADADLAIQSLQQYESRIQSAMFPMVRKIREDVNKVTASLSTKSQVALDVTQWEVQGTLRIVRNTLEKAMTGYDAQAEVTNCFDSLSEAMNLLMHIYDRLGDYHDQQTLGDFIANIGAPGAYDELLRGTEYENDVRALNMNIQSNLVLIEYDSAMAAFLQWVFPFARRYLQKTNLPDSLKPVRDQQTLKDLVVASKKQLESIKSDIKRYWATIPNYLKFFSNGSFFLNKKLGGPFYLWSGHEYHDVIENLFNGQQVTLFADVRESVKFVNGNEDTTSTKRKAIKFSTVYLRFNLAKKYDESKGDEEAKRKNAERQAKFEDILEYFVVNMDHTGTNYYDFQNNIYVIYGDPVTLNYSIRKNDNGMPDITSVSRDKVMKGDLLLSPYTLWSVRLSADKKKAFDDIKEFVEDISLELAGEGTYIFDEFDELAVYELRPYNYYQIDGRKHDVIDSK